MVEQLHHMLYARCNIHHGTAACSGIKPTTHGTWKAIQMAQDPDRRADCLFCQIVEGEQAADMVLETATALVFRDLDPQAPVHLLVIPREHLTDVVELGENAKLAAGVMAAVSEVTRQLGITEFRTVFNTGREGGQHVFHVHAHVLAGRPFSWPPG